MEDVWKDVFAVGTEWDQYDAVFQIPWDFSHLDEAFEKGGILHDQKVYLFSCTEPQLLEWQGKSRVVHVPAVVAVTSPFPPSDKLGIKSVQMEEEMIVPMKDMKMGWVPIISDHDLTVSVERRAKKAKVFALKCTQRKAGLSQLKQERVKKYEYCLPYVYLPHIQDQDEDNTVVDIMYTPGDGGGGGGEGDGGGGEGNPPVVTDFDWTMDRVEPFTDDLISDEQLPASEKDKFMDHVRGLVKDAKAKIKAEKEKRQQVLQDMSEEEREALKNMKLYKFYPKKTDASPDTTQVRSNYINRYYGKANAVL